MNMQKKILIFVLIITFSFFLSVINLKAETLNLERFCIEFTKKIEKDIKECKQLGLEKCLAELEKCEKFYQTQGKKYEKEIKQLQQKERSLSQEIYYLELAIKNLEAEIKSNSFAIQDLTLQIVDTQKSIEKTNEEIENLKNNLAKILRLVYERDQKSLIEIFLTRASLSEFFNELVGLEVLNLETQNLLNTIKTLKKSLLSQKEKMESERKDLEVIVKMKILQQKEKSRAKKYQAYLLEKTRGKEKIFQRLKDKVLYKISKISEIKGKLFELIGVPEGGIPFEKAVSFAKVVGENTGIRPSFLLAVLFQETKLGKVVGSCTWKERLFGRQIMRKAEQKYFQQICRDLGKDPDQVLVSCPLCVDEKRNYISCKNCKNCWRPWWSWGGAMGPAQFIPSTWNLFSEKLKKILKRTPDPFRPLDSFWAAGLYLKSCGANSKSYLSEKKAAICYFAGPKNKNNPRYSWYGKIVLYWAGKIEKCIKSNYQNCKDLPF